MKVKCFWNVIIFCIYCMSAGLSSSWHRTSALAACPVPPQGLLPCTQIYNIRKMIKDLGTTQGKHKESTSLQGDCRRNFSQQWTTSKFWFAFDPEYKPLAFQNFSVKFYGNKSKPNFWNYLGNVTKSHSKVLDWSASCSWVFDDIHWTKVFQIFIHHNSILKWEIVLVLKKTEHLSSF